MDAFLTIPEEKQKRVMEAGYRCFGKLGYKKTAVQDIAGQAGISKGLIFHYFGSKKGMYHFLIQRSYEEICEAFRKEEDAASADFFDRILEITDCKVRCLEKHPSLFSFFTSLYAETDPEVVDLTKQIMENTEAIRSDYQPKEPDIEKFKDPSYAELAFKLLMNYGEGSAMKISNVEEIIKLRDEFARCAGMLKQNLYKPEYLSEIK